MAVSTITTVTRLLTTFESVSVKACWAPRTSLLSRVTSAPVWVRVKKAIGISWMWRNTCERRSKMMPSPSEADTQRCTSDSPASATASAASSSARLTTRFRLPPMMPLLMIDLMISGFTAPITASTTTRNRNAVMRRR